MLRKTVPEITLTVLLIDTLTLAFGVQPVESSGSIYIRADGSIEPTTANIASFGNATYYCTHDNYDEIVVERSNIIIDGVTYALQGDESGNGFYLNSVSNVTIKNTNIREFYMGIYLRSASHNIISGNKVTDNNWQGILLEVFLTAHVVDGEIGVTIANSSTSVYDNRVSRNDIGIALGYHASSASIFRNNITSNWRASILIFSRCSYNRIFENKIIDNSYGIEIDHSSNNEIWHNTLVNNDYQFVIAAGYANFSTTLNFSGPFGSIDSFGVR